MLFEPEVGVIRSNRDIDFAIVPKKRIFDLTTCFIGMNLNMLVCRQQVGADSIKGWYVLGWRNSDGFEFVNVFCHFIRVAAGKPAVEHSRRSEPKIPFASGFFHCSKLESLRHA